MLKSNVSQISLEQMVKHATMLVTRSCGSNARWTDASNSFGFDHSPYMRAHFRL